MFFAKKEGFLYDIDKIKDAYTLLLSMTRYHPTENNIAITVRAGSTDFYDGSPSFLIQDENNKLVERPGYEGAKEEDFRFLHPRLKGTYWEELIDSFKFPYGRIRVMRVLPGRCYVAHKDYSYRYHIPIETNNACFFYFNDHDKTIKIPQDGNLYCVNTLEKHTFINAGSTDRIHLVISGVNIVTNPNLDSFIE